MTASVPGLMSMYRVVPQSVSCCGVVRCHYFQEEGTTPLPPGTPLDCKDQGGKLDFLCILQPKVPPVPSLPDATLFAAVVKTKTPGDDPSLPELPRIYLADNDQRLLLPVYPRMVRQVILIFSRSHTEPLLMSTADPEIKNSTDGVGCSPAPR
jgi:hypothetical protein